MALDSSVLGGGRVWEKKDADAADDDDNVNNKSIITEVSQVKWW